MKRIFVIAVLFLSVTACEKAVIQPNTPDTKPTYSTKSGDGGNTTTTSSTDPNTSGSPDTGDGGAITDPLRKKDQKDNK